MKLQQCLQRGEEEASVNGKKWGEEGGNAMYGRPRRQLFWELGDGNLGRQRTG